jgi:hypothetical protein
MKATKRMENIVGTSLVGYLTLTSEQLTNLLGEPTTFSGGKCSKMWIADFDGKIATIYDHKSEGFDECFWEEYRFHVGSHDESVLPLLEKAFVGIGTVTSLRAELGLV